ncbi:MAG: 1-acyl-sn-glycerol-3-phosphate acyltransferase, partial [Bacteroides sp.]
DYDKYIVCAAPHTSNWDFIIGKLFYGAIGRDTGFMMKKEWFFFPFGALLRYMGGIPVYRDKKTSLVEQVVNEIGRRETFHLAITPEGTRSANPNWKKGFYYIALRAKIPIVLIGIDYLTKTVTANKVIFPTGDMEKEMKEIKLYFTQFTGRIPKNFSVGKL